MSFGLKIIPPAALSKDDIIANVKIILEDIILFFTHLDKSSWQVDVGILSKQIISHMSVDSLDMPMEKK